MLYRAPLLSPEDIRDFMVTVRLYWVQAVSNRITSSVAAADKLATLQSIVDVTNAFENLWESLFVWKSELNLLQEPGVRAYMNPDLFQVFRALVSKPAEFQHGVETEAIHSLMARLQISQPRLLKLLDEAPFIDPAELEATPTPSPKGYLN